MSSSGSDALSWMGGGSGALFSVVVDADLLAGAVTFIASSLLGGIIGYERSHGRNLESTRAPRASAPISNYEAETCQLILGWGGHF